MPINIEVDSKTPHIIHQQFAGQWSWKDFRESNKQVWELLNLHPEQKFYVISDFMDGQVLPSGSPLLYARESFQKAPSNLDFLIIVVSSQFIKVLVTGFAPVARTVFGIQLHTCQSVDEAIQLITNSIQYH